MQKTAEMLDTQPDAKVAVAPAPKRVPADTMNLQFAGDLVLVKKPDPIYSGFYRRYEAIFESCANVDRTHRLLRYKLLTALILTSYAKKETNKDKKREYFDKKNQLFIDIANNPNYRGLVGFKYLQSKNFRVLEYCEKCKTENAANGLERHKFKHCENCTIDKDFFNVLSMFHRFDEGSFCIFISNELIHKIKLNNPRKKVGKLDDFKEMGKFEKFTYNVKNLDAIKIAATMKLFDKIIGK